MFFLNYLSSGTIGSQRESKASVVGVGQEGLSTA